MIDESLLPFSQACENNKLPILQILQQHLPGRQSVLELGGGSGQHAVFFARQFPRLNWQASDVPAQVDTLNLRIQQAALPNLPPAIAIDVDQPDWDCGCFDAIFSANSLHIMPVSSGVCFFAGAGRHVGRGGLLLVYGPFKYAGRYTSDSNASFDDWLKQRDPRSGIRDFEWADGLAREAGFELLADNAMPANNQLLVWVRQ